MAREFNYSWSWDLRSSADVLWPLVADTDRFNRDAGLPVVERVATDTEEPTVARRHLRFRRLGVTVEWVEEPFEWVEPSCFGVIRTYRSGPLLSMRVRVDLLPLPDGGTRLQYDVAVTARNALGWTAIPIQIGWLSFRDFTRVFRAYDKSTHDHTTDASTAGGLVTRIPSTPVKFARGGRRRLQAAQNALLTEGIDADLVPRLTDVVATCDDLSAHQLRPYELADIWGIPRRQVLEACLVATRCGLLEFEWHLLCPLCRGAKARTPSLGGVEPVVHCDTCNIDFEVNFERSVELTFHPDPAIRAIVRGEYCIAGPRVTPHVVAQQLLAPGDNRTIQLNLEPGSYRVRLLNERGVRILRAAAGGPDDIALPMRAVGWPEGELDVSLTPKLHLLNKLGAEQLVIVERQTLSDQAATGADVIGLQKFRDLFAAEALRPGERISVGNLAVLFTDLYGSTQIYSNIGDATAFGVVMSHFDVLRDAVNQEDGAVIKTMGDSVMAVFRHPVQALRAVLAAQEQLAGDKGELSGLRLKAGIHWGPCISVTLNGSLDYFGTTVNVAARLQGLSEGDDVVVSDAICNDPEVVDFLEDLPAHLQIDHLETELRGFDGTSFAIARLASKQKRCTA
ncbi:MAG: hypothetical protein HOM68_11220 [Gemmatimonadetes bacterium]|jgi:class 3 adenylate cyclase|nr:hypothetical protein [Gemmatimonadota bacterium]MBT5057099.1 hypothetical protein [Gemmatimonadota bacterium]MBT5142161.1 hypothetical protein [Gemmatimonadota bacterium]MBT5589254.1 hypothetical protein [Gemmatimonadota bacterium]MBT5963096.1 hypothetical protein [Gemmatimonadota bacterium]